ncbi:ADP-ribose pyrophosphatase [Paucibacter oligotrophus]|uniref:GDP-mannose pyrophosphatase n=1 Tax=Roseateles oligotrophus TaxID=1769250 RepID=A0A840LE78_9BURK|nr:NUDIX hydrolase [Roseateles oligotrophus]MBB4844942.1 ADP-ribose pyrophosphatase [Roseateles oligotrophus]
MPIEPVAGCADLHLREQGLQQETVFSGNFLKVQRDTVRLPDGKTATREFIRHPGAVMIVPLLDDGRLLLERQFRYPMGRVMLEFPAGKLDAGEAALHCAQRELLEETGYQAREWAHAGVLHNAIAYSDEGIEIFFARGLKPGQQALDEGEFLDLVTHSVGELDQLAAQGQLTDAKTLIGLLWLSRWQGGAWALDWQAAA